MMSSFSFTVLAIGLRIKSNRQIRRQEQLVKRWEPAMLEVLGGAAEPEEIHSRVDDRDGLAFLRFLLGYARLLRGDEIALVRAMAAPYLPSMIPRLQRGTAESRGNAVLILARMGMPRYADNVAEALADESPVVAMIAARSLFRPGQEEHFPAVLAHLPRFTGWSRSFLASILAGGGPNIAPLLRDIMRNPEEPALVRAVASDALRELNDLDSVPVAVELIASETDRELIVGCLKILKHLGHHEHVRYIRSIAASRDPIIRAAAVSALSALGSRSEIPLLEEKLDDPSFWVSLEAARGLLALGESSTLERLAASVGPWSMMAKQVLSE